MDRSLRIALLAYKGNPFCGGQGVYVRHLSRELARLGHTVEVLAGQPYPVLDLDEGVALTEIASLDLYRQPDPFRTPRRHEYRDLIDVLEVGTMWTAGFPEPLKSQSANAAVSGPPSECPPQNTFLVRSRRGIPRVITVSSSRGRPIWLRQMP